MLVKNEELKNFVEIFNKKFSNFCQKAPILLSFNTSPTGSLIKDETTGKSLSYVFDFSLSVKENIFIIKEWLLKECYPIMIEEYEIKEEYTPDELREMDENNINIDSLIMQGKHIKVSNLYRIEKVIVIMDHIFVRDLQTDKLTMWKMNMPVSIFLKSMRQKWNQQYAWQVFKDKAVFVKNMEE